MALPAYANGDGTLIQYFYKDNLTNDYMTAVYYTYSPGLTPQAGGVNVFEVVNAAANTWANIWVPLVAVPLVFYRTVAHHFRSFIPKPPNRFKLQSIARAENDVSVPGTKTGDMLPAFCAYNVKKITGRVGRSGNGHMRVPGIPVTEHQDGTLIGTWHTLVQNVIADPTAFNIKPNGATSDTLLMAVVNGRRINTLPALPIPADNMDLVESITLAFNVTTQVTRKFGRRRT